DQVYHDNLVFGIPRGSPRSRAGQHHGGHWKDRLAEVQEDVAYLQRLLQQHGGEGKEYQTFAGEAPLSIELRIEHSPIPMARPGVDLVVSARVLSPTPVRQVLLHYRPLDQTADWQQMAMQSKGDDRWQATVPGKNILARW